MNICPNCDNISMTDHGQCLECSYIQEDEERSYSWIPIVVVLLWIIGISWAIGEHFK